MNFGRKLERQIDDFLEETRMQRDYHRDMHTVMSRITKFANDLKRNLVKLEEIETKYGKEKQKCSE